MRPGNDDYLSHGYTRLQQEKLVFTNKSAHVRLTTVNSANVVACGLPKPPIAFAIVLAASSTRQFLAGHDPELLFGLRTRSAVAS